MPVIAKPIDRELVTNADLKRFWAKVDTTDADGCWNWTASCYHNGYGSFSFNGRSVKAHRFAWVVAQTLPPVQDPRADICHSCDNRLCCNPAHLRQDTRSSNHRDKRKNGNASPIQKLTCEQVVEIKALLKEGKLTQRKIGDRYGVDHRTISAIKRGTCWAD